MTRDGRLCIDIGFCDDHPLHPISISYRRRALQFHSTISEMSWLNLKMQAHNGRFQPSPLRNWKVLDYRFCFRLWQLKQKESVRKHAIILSNIFNDSLYHHPSASCYDHDTQITISIKCMLSKIFKNGMLRMGIRVENAAYLA